MAEEDCKDGSCEIDPYGKISKDIHNIYNPAQLNSRNHAYAASPKRRAEVKIVVKKFIEEWLTGGTKYQRIIGE